MSKFFDPFQHQIQRDGSVQQQQQSATGSVRQQLPGAPSRSLPTPHSMLSDSIYYKFQETMAQDFEVVDSDEVNNNNQELEPNVIGIPRTGELELGSSRIQPVPQSTPGSMTPVVVVADRDRDIQVLNQLGLQTQLSANELLGIGTSGRVYRGRFGPAIGRLSRQCGLRNFTPGARFAVKCVELTTTTGSAATVQRRISYEIEKRTMERVSHRNCVPFRMAINMGPPVRVRHLTNPGYNFLSYNRMYLVMDESDQGSLRDWLQMVGDNTINSYLCCKLVRDMIAGMYYLHRNGIVHGDVHDGNVLLFSDTNDTIADSNLVAKWVDFGYSLLSGHWSASHYASATDWKKFQRNDCQEMIRLCEQVLEKSDPLVEPKANISDWWLLVDHLRQTPNLRKVIDNDKQQSDDTIYTLEIFLVK